ncbi:MAG: response regulator transcription factor [Planctomycetaceae bacterium]
MTPWNAIGAGSGVNGIASRWLIVYLAQNIGTTRVLRRKPSGGVAAGDVHRRGGLSLIRDWRGLISLRRWSTPEAMIGAKSGQGQGQGECAMGERKRILIVEDEEAIARGLMFNFEAEGYEAIVLGDGPSTLNFFREQPNTVDLVVLDLMLPGMSGYEICRGIREQDSTVPVLVLSARTLSEDRAYAFDCGTDQYLTKPFALPELLSRVRNLLDRHQRLTRHIAESKLTDYRFDDVTVDFRAFTVQRGEETSTLTTMEAQLLGYFFSHVGVVLSRQEILRDVWDQEAEVTTRTIDNFVMRLRKYIEVDPANPKHLLSVRGTGYRFVRETDSQE